MKLSLSFEESYSDDLSIMVDTFRASSTIISALDKFNKIIPCFSPKEAIELKKEKGGILAGERNGLKIKGFDLGNSPEELKNFKKDKKIKTLILTTSNGTRALEKIKSKNILIGSFINSKAVGKKSIQLAKEHINLVMAGAQGDFSLEDFLASGDILYNIKKEMELKKIEYEITDFALAAILASQNNENIKKIIYQSKSAKKLKLLNYENDIKFCLKKNISDKVAIYKDSVIEII